MNQENSITSSPETRTAQPARTNRPRRPDARWTKVAELLASGVTVTVQVVDVVSKEGRACGLNTKLEGLRAFLPASLVPRNESFQTLVGQTIEVKVVECDPNDRGGKLVVSRVAALAEARKQAIALLTLGSEVTGKVVSVVKDLGYFVNIGAIDALLHVTQTPLEGGSPKVFAVGDTLTARISAISEETGKVGLSMRAPRPEGQSFAGRNAGRNDRNATPRVSKPFTAPTASSEPVRKATPARALRPVATPRAVSTGVVAPKSAKDKGTTFTSFADLAAHLADKLPTE